jgi:hypothetical protein
VVPAERGWCLAVPGLSDPRVEEWSGCYGVWGPVVAAALTASWAPGASGASGASAAGGSGPSRAVSSDAAQARMTHPAAAAKAARNPTWSPS